MSKFTNTITVRAYVDGACRGNPGFGACGGHIEWPDGTSREFAHIEPDITTNFRMELMAVVQAMRVVASAMERSGQRAALYIYSDCQSVVQCAGGENVTRSNADLWQAFHREVGYFPGAVVVQWVPREDNMRADSIVAAAFDENEQLVCKGAL